MAFSCICVTLPCLHLPSPTLQKKKTLEDQCYDFKNHVVMCMLIYCMKLLQEYI